MDFLPKRLLSHTTVQCEVYRLLVNAGFRVYAEYRHMGSEVMRGCIFDLVIHAAGRVQVIIEVKRSYRSIYMATERNGVGTKQYRKYTSFDIPVLLVCGEDDLEAFTEAVVKDYGHLIEG